MLLLSIVDNDQHRLVDGAEPNARDQGAGFVAVTDVVNVLVVYIVIIGSLVDGLLLILVAIVVVVAVSILAVVSVSVVVVVGVVVVMAGVVVVSFGFCDHRFVDAVRRSGVLRQSPQQARLQRALPSSMAVVSLFRLCVDDRGRQAEGPRGAREVS